MICGPFRAPVLGPMPGSSGTCGQGYCSSRTQFWLMRGPWGSASPPLLLSEAYLRFKGLPFSMAVECDSLLPPHPSVAMHFTIWAGKGPGAFASCLLASLPPSSLSLPLPIWHPPVASPSFLPCSSSSCLLLSPYLLSVFVSTLRMLGLVSSFLPALVLEIRTPCGLPRSVHLDLPRLFHVEWIFCALAPGALELGSPFAGNWIPCEIRVREGPQDRRLVMGLQATQLAQGLSLLPMCSWAPTDL